jgi:hypothetical protein
MNRLSPAVTSLLTCSLALYWPLLATAQSPPAGEIKMTSALAISGVSRAGRSATHTDAVEAQLVAGSWKTPHEGDTVTLPGGASRRWVTVTANKDGAVAGPEDRGGYLCWTVNAPSAGIWILSAVGDGMAYVNGVPRAGDTYGTDKTHLPVDLHAGENTILFTIGGGGSVHAVLDPPHSDLMLDPSDPTLPDWRPGDHGRMKGAVIVINATGSWQPGATIEASCGSDQQTSTRLAPLAPLTTRKVAFDFTVEPQAGASSVPLHLALRDHGHEMDTCKFDVRLRKPTDVYTRTFVSSIDGSVQYYAVNPVQPLPGDHSTPALVLTLHGAGVEAVGQAAAYSPKTWANIVAATNRRPFGFDWEDWGRLDAMEVLANARHSLPNDPSTTYLTGHSMGGHGTWQLGVTFPGQFAVIGPSAGWISFMSYVGGTQTENSTSALALLRRAMESSDTLAMVNNLKAEGVYIIHGTDDDNVPVTEAREMAKQLATFHHDWYFHEQPGVGHWWGLPNYGGAACVDWPPLFDDMSRHRVPDEKSVRDVDFTTVNPGVSSSLYWLTIYSQEHAMEPSRVQGRLMAAVRRCELTTKNASLLSIRLDGMEPGAPVDLVLDGQSMEKTPWPSTGVFWLRHMAGSWSLTAPPAPGMKGPQRYGPFKSAFNNRMIFVYGTGGGPEENAWAYARARYDAETFWYRGNGAVDIVPDRQFDARHEPDRGVILYGNADTNTAWAALLGSSPVQVHRGTVTVGSRTVSGDSLACLLTRPRPGSNTALVGVVSGTGLPGMRLTERLNYFFSGVEFPDCTILSPEMLTGAASGVRLAGFFGEDWSLDSGEWGWAGDHPAAVAGTR